MALPTFGVMVTFFTQKQSYSQDRRVYSFYCARFGFVVILLSFRQLDCYRLQIQVKKQQKMAKNAYFFKKKY